MQSLLPSVWLIRAALAAVWIYEGLWCKLLRGQPHEFKVVAAVPWFGPRIGGATLATIGGLEIFLGIWILSDLSPTACAATQTALLVAMNAAGLRWARHIIADPAGMIVKNFAFLVLVWVNAGLRGGL